MGDPHHQSRYPGQNQYGSSYYNQNAYAQPYDHTHHQMQPEFSHEQAESVSYKQQENIQAQQYRTAASHQPQQHVPQNMGGPVPDPFMTDMASALLRNQGENYFQRGHAFVQSKMGFLSSSNLHYHFNIDTTYVRDKLLLLLLPFLKQWSFSRKPEQISGGHRYQPPRQDTYAPDLYIPFMAVCTYIVLVSIAQTAGLKFTQDKVYLTASGAFSAWLLHWVVIKMLLYMLGIPSSVPFLEILAYAGYPFVYACLGLLISFSAGLWPYRALLLYGGLAMGTFMVRTMKHVVFHDSPHFRSGARLNYWLLGLALFQFPFLAWLYIRPYA